MIVLLATDDMLSTKPQDVEIKHNWGHCEIVVVEAERDRFVGGTHIAVEGPIESIKGWLRPFDGVWFGVGSPVLQEFEVGHIKED